MRETYDDGDHTGVDMCRSAVAQGRSAELSHLLLLGSPKALVEQCACGVKGSRWGDEILADRVFRSYLLLHWASERVDAINREFLQIAS